MTDEQLLSKFDALIRERDALREYLHDICDAYEAWVKASDEDEIVAARNALDDQIARVCDARQEHTEEPQ